MKKSSIKSVLVLAIILSALVSRVEAFAAGFKVEDGESTYVTKIVTAKNVKGLEIRLSKTVFRDSCNEISMSMTPVLVSGDGHGLYDKYFFDAGMRQTLMHCPLDKPVTETIYSTPIFIKSFTNENANTEVVVSFVIPAGYEVDVRVVK
jgi:hypothetical protein